MFAMTRSFNACMHERFPIRSGAPGRGFTRSDRSPPVAAGNRFPIQREPDPAQRRRSVQEIATRGGSSLARGASPSAGAWQTIARTGQLREITVTTSVRPQTIVSHDENGVLELKLWKQTA
jgi:hypothetical protein